MLLTQIEKTMGFEVGRIGIEAQIENALGLTNVDAIAAASPRVETIIFGPADFMASINMKSLVVGRAAAGLRRRRRLPLHPHADPHGGPRLRQAGDRRPVPADPRRRGLQARRRSLARRSASTASGCCTPTRSTAANEVFTPRQDDYDHAELILDAYDYYTSAEGGARGAVMLGDEMIDEASRKMALVISAKGRAAGMARTQAVHAACGVNCVWAPADRVSGQ